MEQAERNTGNLVRELNKPLGKSTIIITVLWIAMALAPFVHPVGGTPVFLGESLYYLALYIPITLLIILFMDYRKRSNGIVRLFNSVPFNSVKFWFALFYSILAVIFAFIVWTQVLGHYIPMRGSAPSAGLAIAVAFVLMRRFQDMGAWQSAFVGLLGAAFFVGASEIPYQICAQLFIWGAWNSPVNHIVVILQQLTLSLPFIAALLLYGIRPTKWSAVAFGAFVATMLVWVFYFDFWTIATFKVVNGQHMQILHTPINWAAYEMDKLSGVAFACIVLGLIRVSGKKLF